MKKTLVAIATVVVMGALALTAYRWRDHGVRTADANASNSPAVQSTRTARRDSTAPAISPNAAPIAGGVRKVPSDPQLLPPGPVRDYLPGLLAQANAPNATAEASFRAFAALNACRFLASYRDSTRGARKSGDEKSVPATPAPGEPDCRGVNQEDWADSLRYLKRAAEMGDRSAASDHAVYVYGSGLPLTYLSREDLIAHPEAVLEWRQDASRMLLGAAESGSLDAMFGLSSAYETGRLGETSPLLAYEYAFTERELAGNNPNLDVYVDRLAAKLTPDQLGRAQQAAQGFIARCCKSR